MILAVRSFDNSGHLLKEMNKTYSTVIPKVERLTSVTQFRPISLCNTSYKIISKCVVRRLKLIICEIVGEFQNAFVPGRSTTDNCLIAVELITHLKKRKGRKIQAAVKVDLNKAYDRIRWEFVLTVLKAIGFREKTGFENN